MNYSTCDHLEMSTPSRFTTAPISVVQSLEESLLIDTSIPKKNKNIMAQTCDSLKYKHKKTSSARMISSCGFKSDIRKMVEKSLRPDKASKNKKKINRRKEMVNSMSNQ